MTLARDKYLTPIRAHVEELQHATLHGPIPTKTTMQLVQDLVDLLALLDEQSVCSKCDLCEDHA